MTEGEGGRVFPRHCERTLLYFVSVAISVFDTEAATAIKKHRLAVTGDWIAMLTGPVPERSRIFDLPKARSAQGRLLCLREERVKRVTRQPLFGSN